MYFKYHKSMIIKGVHMPIDFNANVFYPKNNFVQKHSVQKAFTGAETKDTFVKTINVNDDMTTDYTGISITQKDFGTLQKSGKNVKLYTITNKNGASVDLSEFGATITAIKVPDKNGQLTDVTQGYNNVTPYETSPIGHAGGTIGPCANKINEGKFTINNQSYTLETNKDNGKTHCHGGSDGLDVKLWNTKILPDGIEFSYTKKDMENGYPANVDIKVTYKLDNNNRLHIKYDATTDKDTLLNLTNHTYFNLDGEHNTSENSVLDHNVKFLNTSHITENNEIAIPTGKLLSIKNTPFDFSESTKIKDSIYKDSEQLKIGSGFDQNYCIDNYDGKTMIDVAEIESEKTGIKLKVSTNMPGFQFYTSNHLGKNSQPEGKSGARYEKRSALCIEPQVYPNAINTESFKEKGILKKDEVYDKEIIYSFSTK